MTLEETAAGTPAATAGETGKAVGEFMRNLFPEGGVLDRLFTVDTAVRVIRVGLTIVVGILLVGLIVAIIRRVISKRLDTRNGAVIVKVVQYAGIALIVINAFEAAQVDLSALLGAAGIAGIAIGFAAQTSVSNFISGFFLVSDKTFAVGDILTVDGITGEVYAIETLSVKLKTFDNRLVRIPNETLIKSNVINVTRFPVRRLNIQVTVPHGTDIARARGALLGAAAANPAVLRNPEPFFMVQAFSKDGIELFLGVWFDKEDWERAHNGTHEEIQRRFEADGIRFAYPTINVAATEPGVRAAGKRKA